MRSVDVIVPCYNGARFLGATLDSALSQTHPAVRILVVDDGSTDGTRGVVERYAGRVEYVAKANGGQASARNLGIARTSGDLVLCLDADDLLAPDMIARLAARLDARPEVDLAFASPLAFFETGPDGVPRHAYAETWRPEGPWPEYLGPLSIFCALHTSSTLVRRGALERHGPFPEDRAIQGCEDWHLWLAATLVGARFEHVEGVLTYYRQHATSSSASVRGIAARESELGRRAAALFEGAPVGRVTDRDRAVLSLGLRRIATRWLGLGEHARHAEVTALAERLAPASTRASLRRRASTWRLDQDAGSDAGRAVLSRLQVAIELSELGLPRLAAVVLAQTPLDAGTLRAVDDAWRRGEVDRLVVDASRTVAAALADGEGSRRPSFFANVAVVVARHEALRGRPGEAREALLRALALDPGHRGAWWALSILDARDGSPAAALRAALQAGRGPSRDVALDVARRVLARSPRARQLASDVLGVSLRALSRATRHG